MKKGLPALVLGLFLASCSAPPPTPVDGGKLNVVATTSIVADVVSQVGGDFIDVQILLPEGTDPHSFDPTPQDIAKVADADIVFANGAGLEDFIEHLLDSADAEERIIEVSEGIELLEHSEEDGDHAEGEEHEEDEDHAHEMGDPHTWTDPNNVIIWVKNIETALAAADPANAGIYAENAAAYTSELKEVDAWIRAKIEQIPPEKRKIVTDHRLLGYYVDEYGLEMAGAIIPGYSSLSEPSAQELAAIEDIIDTLDVQAIFVGKTVNPNLAERIAEDTGVSLVYFYTGSLSSADGEAGSYLDYLRYNTNAFVNALK
ncbi:MAG: zinc ABC transporter substrate-binding protein [Anaerolineae bacterium]|jgi:ABC-type Zn uptake system ZnuABC Zn-binding protein ZnuA|nr:zinc ABC transporter substrate-binding protein [Anaerolineae bacterium]MBT7189076.1 zinc ABC transporter substrate-binding protein [Anaerolineae bacterium]MBT7990349.1 zinc ABC transporter substrate-binding protein [Anaerolineae bacterium]